MTIAQTPFLPDVFSGQQRLVVLAPHPDDESLGCGGLLARAFGGAGAHVVCLTDGSASHPNSALWTPRRLARRRHTEMITALKRLGGTARDLTWMGMPDAGLYRADVQAVAGELARIIDGLDASQIFVPAVEDSHEDHQAAAKFAQELRVMRPEWTYYAYPVWSRWNDPDFDSNIARHAPIFLPLGDLCAKKRAAIHAHQSQLGQIVPDDPSGFTLPPGFVDKFLLSAEIFWRMP
ncbi:PIG-L family deacetylase [Rhodobacteraceae bacterium KMM 6894]|nr:PIG-L family deacetylase [Rhodobacteraceae bacterium KMM 6894]